MLDALIGLASGGLLMYAAMWQSQRAMTRIIDFQEREKFQLLEAQRDLVNRLMAKSSGEYRSLSGKPENGAITNTETDDISEVYNFGSGPQGADLWIGRNGDNK